MKSTILEFIYRVHFTFFRTSIVADTMFESSPVYKTLLVRISTRCLGRKQSKRPLCFRRRERVSLRVTKSLRTSSENVTDEKKNGDVPGRKYEANYTETNVSPAMRSRFAIVRIA